MAKEVTHCLKRSDKAPNTVKWTTKPRGRVVTASMRRYRARLDGMVKITEFLIKIVNYNKPNMLIGLNQKV